MLPSLTGFLCDIPNRLNNAGKPAGIWLYIEGICAVNEVFFFISVTLISNGVV